mmetsp:Transcript_8851/g.11772  ORF Transcript_8851/g.11772 Transcript_8851/m.11772 type:complete len:263 (+) Transcript_8851:245-1033(+)|eukprot:CAMPEP_0198142302 /NCGR_PEP_ID=MMETSP1443-20131203/5122_1 /TAXON_ID=186043 /ORGANISM="Entomoneis sp., Strain CCMP2396" /LENGTH=262 /DNA_ID=CAMNT_0043805273 /DNA_START=240 /DNA_END=1028 /DNA_ORIENTATION=+
MITDFVPHLAVPLRVAAFLVASILVHGVIFRSPSSHLRSLKRGASPKHAVYVTHSFIRRTSTTVKNNVPPISVQVSLEALCIDSKNYVLNDLVHTYSQLGPDVMDLSVISYGNAKLNETTHQVVCQHGKAECDANVYQQCAIDRFPSPQRYLPFLQCLFETLPMGRSDTPFDPSMFSHCARRSALDWSALQTCHDDPDESWRLQYQSAQRTPSYHDHFPLVGVSGAFVSETNSLLQAVCDAYMKEGGQHPVCISPSATQQNL